MPGHTRWGQAPWGGDPAVEGGRARNLSEFQKVREERGPGSVAQPGLLHSSLLMPLLPSGSTEPRGQPLPTVEDRKYPGLSFSLHRAL